jgi:hypothetical protein
LLSVRTSVVKIVDGMQKQMSISKESPAIYITHLTTSVSRSELKTLNSAFSIAKSCEQSPFRQHVQFKTHGTRVYYVMKKKRKVDESI